MERLRENKIIASVIAFILSIVLVFADEKGNQIQEDNFAKEVVGAIEDKVKIGDKEKDISYTDINTDETLIIKSDAENYYHYFGYIQVFFSITNTTLDDQQVDISLSLEDKETVEIKNISRFMGNATTTVPEFTDPVGSTEQPVTIPAHEVQEPVWEELKLSKFKNKTHDRKDNKNTVAKQEAKTQINSGETVYFMANVRVRDMSEGAEFFVEAFGNKGAYGHLDPFSYSQDFEGLSTGDLNGQDSWTGSTAVDVQTSIVNTGSQGLEGIYTGSTYTITTDRGVAFNEGDLYINFRSSNVGHNELIFMRLLEGASSRGYMKMDASGNFQYFDGATYNTIFTMSADTWYELYIEWRNTNEWRFTVDGGTPTAWDTLVTWSTGIDGIMLGRDKDISGASVYWDDFLDTSAGGGGEEAIIRQDIIWFE